MTKTHKPTGTKPANIQAAERRLEALRLRALRFSYSDIGNRLGISRQRACQLVQQELEAISIECRETAERVRNLESMTLDALQLANSRAAMAGDTQATAIILKIQERRARLLGLDMPTKIAPTTPDGEAAYNLPSISDAELIRWAQEHGVTVSDETDNGTVES